MPAVQKEWVKGPTGMDCRAWAPELFGECLESIINMARD
jgi:hypothetical protein